MFTSHQKGKFVFKFANGVAVSVIWGGGSYSDNHTKLGIADIMGTVPVVESSTAEVMIVEDPTKENKAIHHVEDNYGANPAGYLSPENVTDILMFVRSLNG